MPAKEPSPPLSSEELEDLQLFLKDWLRHTGRTQADLRRALRATSIRMPVLVSVLQHIHAQQGLRGLAEQLCQIESLWHREDSHPQVGAGAIQAHPAPDSIEGDPMDQLDLLLDEIRSAAEDSSASLYPRQDAVD
ncbi:MAG: hypothetical protein ACKOOC_09550 [Cyanobium sp.]